MLEHNKPIKDPKVNEIIEIIKKMINILPEDDRFKYYWDKEFIVVYDSTYGGDGYYIKQIIDVECDKNKDWWAEEMWPCIYIFYIESTTLRIINKDELEEYDYRLPDFMKLKESDKIFKYVYDIKLRKKYNSIGDWYVPAMDTLDALCDYWGHLLNMLNNAEPEDVDFSNLTWR